MNRTRLFLAAMLWSFVYPLAAQDILIAARKDAKWGYLNTAGTFVLPAQYEDAYPFYKGLAVVKDKGLFGVIDAKGKWVISPRKGTMLGEINSNRIVTQNEAGKWGAVDSKGKEQVAAEYDVLSAFQNGWALGGKKTSAPELVKVIALDTVGRAVVSFDNIYLPAKSFSESKKIREGYVSLLVDGEFKDLLTESDLKIDGRTLYYALLDVKNRKLVNVRIPSLKTEVREGRLNLTKDGISYSWSVPLATDISLNEAKFKILSDAIHPFSGGVAAINKNGKWAYIDKDGSLLSETNLPASEYTSMDPVYFGGFVIFKKTNGMEIFTDLNGNQKIAIELEAANPFQYGFAIVKSKGKFGLLQKDGTWAVPAEFDDLRF